MDWMDKVIENLDKKIPISDLQIIDFVTGIKSTHVIFEISSGTTVSTNIANSYQLRFAFLSYCDLFALVSATP